MGGYIGSSVGNVANAAERKQTYSITTATTSLTGLAYTPTKVHVFHNGVRLVDGTDYTATNGTSITLTNAAQNGDEVVVISYPSFQTSDTVSAANGGTFAGDVTMSSNLNVDTIKNTSGTTLIDADLSIDIWRLTANFSTNAATITGWERPDDGYQATINGLSESSGVFTFTKTGLYQISFNFNAQNASSTDGSMGVIAYVSTNGGSSYDDAALAYSGDVDQGTNNSAGFVFHVNVTNASNTKIKFDTSSLASGTFISGDTNQNYTHFSSIKVAPAQ
jgi:hypothetical protein